MDYGFLLRIEELRRTCPSNWMVYVTRAKEMPGVAPADEIATTDIVLGTVGDDITALYQAWLDA